MRDEEKRTGARALSIAPHSSRPHSLVRVFCAVELPAEVRLRAVEHINSLQDAVQGARVSWERADKLHITLKFLGEIAPNRLQTLSDAATRAALSTQPFTLALEGAGSFPTRGLPRILWLGINDASGSLTQLQSNLEEECERLGFAPEERPFRPHLTIARIRAPQAARKLAQVHQEFGFEAMLFPANELVVMRSELGPVGSSYTAISRHGFEIEANG